MNKSFFHIILVLAMAISSTPFVLPALLMIQRAFAVYEMKEKLEHEELQQVTVEVGAIHWLKPGKECMINSRMFDVKQIEPAGDSIRLKGLYDDKEKAITAQIESLSIPITHDQERASIIYQITHLVLDLNESSPPDYAVAKTTMKFPPVLQCSRKGWISAPHRPPNRI